MREQTQADKFKEAARELECEQDEQRWNQRLRTILTRHPEADELTPEDGPEATG